MPFEPSLDSSALAPSNDLAESIVRRLWEVEPAMEVVGPTTTQLYDGRPQRLDQLVEDFDLDYVVNGRDTVSERGPRVLLEIIRAGDGAHVWVRYLDEMADADVAETVARATAGAAAGGVP
jgi:TolB-like protein